MKSTWSLTDIQRSFALRHEPEEYARFAKRYWALLLIATTVCMCGGIAFGAWQFFAPAQSVMSEPAQQGIMGFNREQLTKVVTVLEERRANFETMMTGE